MPPLNPSHRRQTSQSTHPRASTLPPTTTTPFSPNTTATMHQGNPSTSTSASAFAGPNTHTSTNTTSSAGSVSMSAAKTRQYAHLHAQLAQLNAHLADTENLLRMTAVQAGDMRFLGGYVGALFMGSAKVLGEEGVKGCADEIVNQVVKKEEEENAED